MAKVIRKTAPKETAPVTAPAPKVTRKPWKNTAPVTAPAPVTETAPAPTETAPAPVMVKHFQDNGLFLERTFWEYYWTLNYKPLCRAFFEHMSTKYDYFPLMVDARYKAMFADQIKKIREHATSGKLSRKDARAETIRLLEHLFKRLESDIASLGLDFDKLFK